MTHTFTDDATLGTSGAIDYTASDVTAHTGNQTGAGQRVCVFRHTGQADGVDYYNVRGKRPWAVMIGMSGWTDAAYVDSITAGGLYTNKLAYELLKRGWVIFSGEVTEAGATVTGNGAAHLPGTTKFADPAYHAWNKDIRMLLQYIKENADTYGIDPNCGIGISGSSGAHILAWEALRTFVPGEFGDPATDTQYGFDTELAGLVGGNLPWAWEPWIEDKSVVGGVAATTLTGDTVGTTKASLPNEHRKGFAPYWWMQTDRRRLTPMFLSYSDAAVGTVFEAPGIQSVETAVHPVTMGEIAKRQFPGTDTLTGLPWVTLSSFTSDGTTPTFGSNLCNRWADKNNVLDQPQLTESLAWCETIARARLVDDYETPSTKSLLTPASTQWVLALPPNPKRTGEAVISANSAGGTDPRYLEVLAQPQTYPEPAATVLGDIIRVNISGAPTEPKNEWRRHTTGPVWVKSQSGVAELVTATG